MCSKDRFLTIIGGLLIAFCVKAISGQSTLKAVAMIIRHGDRAPDKDYALNPYSDYKWPGGFGALSPKGVRELYYSGIIKSRRYASLLVPSCSFCTFDINKVYVQSSGYPRCIESGKSFLGGFLPVSYPDSLIRVTPLDEDEMVGYGKICPKFEQENNDWKDIRNPAYRELIDIQSEEGKQFIEYFENSTGMTIDDFYVCTDITQIQLDNGLEMPRWAESIFDRLLIPMLDIGFELMGSNAYSHIRSGVHLKDIMDRFLNFISGSSDQNILFYSAHDVNVKAMMHHLDVSNQTTGRPAYGSMFNMEIYDNSAIPDDYEIKLVHFVKYGDENPIELDIPNCKAPCPFKKYLEMVKPKFILDFDEACQQ